ncbi:MAG: hypothetical protein WBW78_14555, partial [Terrimicrobiaceae bacterium]
MTPTADSAGEAGPDVKVSAPGILSRDDGKRSARLFFRLESGRLIPCEPDAAEIIIYTSPTMDDEAELQEQYNIDYHTLQSSLDPD